MSVVSEHLDLMTLYYEPVKQETKATPQLGSSAYDIANQWILSFDAAIRGRYSGAILNLFQEGGKSAKDFAKESLVAGCSHTVLEFPYLSSGQLN